MRFRSVLCLLAVVFIGISNRTGAKEGMTSLESEHQKWLEERITEAKSVKLGTSRTALLRVFDAEAGAQSMLPTRYVLKSCPMIKIDVTFSPALAGQPKDLGRDLQIATISSLYLDYVVVD